MPSLPPPFADASVPSPATAVPTAVPTALPGGAEPPDAGEAAAAASSTGPVAPRHSWVDDLFGLATGIVVVAFGLDLLHAGGAVTGGTAGLSLLIGFATGWRYTIVLVVINLPFLAIALAVRGWVFTLKSIVSVVLVAVVSAYLPTMITWYSLNPVFAVLMGDLLCGVGLLVLFRHDASMGGLNISALILQDRIGWRAGYTLMAADLAIVCAALPVLGPRMTLLSAAGVVVVGVVLALNHRPGRYLG